MKVISVLPLNEWHKAFLKSKADAEFIYSSPEEVNEEMLADADVILGNIPPRMLAACKSLKLMQLNSAGTDGYTAEGVLAPETRLANATGAYGLAISEHMLAMLLMLMKKLDRYHDLQKETKWEDAGGVTSIYGSTTLVLGLGDIGGEFAARMKALGSHVIGIRRTGGEKPSYVDEIDTTENFKKYVPQADIIAMSLPGTPATYHIVDQSVFRMMKPGAFLLNVGRGTAIDPAALYEALQNGTLGGAGIDVTEPEPLPKDSPLWQCKNLLITPHISGGFHLPETFERIVRICGDNLEALAKGTPLRNEVDFTTGYRRR
ncbi:MAG: D-2-hydroxyacid dehydrogenase [Firmicutes bacterium]|nr:D-2-hydroxyacid dehydrogenase [Bacillota bacterium]